MKAPRRSRKEESGYAYLMALFLVLGMMVGSQVVLRNLITERISQREEEAIWRGNQYVRAVRIYYRKTGHYPQKVDDLLTGVPDIHFLRSEAMKDPMNKDEGAWRFIYTNAAGAIIGSVKYGSLQQMALMDMNGGQMPGTQPGQPGSTTAAATTDPNAQNNSTNPQNGQTPPANAPGIGQSPFQSNPTGSNTFSLGSQQTTATGTGAPGSNLGPGQVIGALGQAATPLGSMQPTGAVDGPVVGGMLIGVGSKVDKKSVRVYKGGKKYNAWEFIWNPLEEQAQAVQQGLGQLQNGAGLSVGGLPLGQTSAFSNGASGTTAPPAPTNGDGSNNPQSPQQQQFQQQLQQQQQQQSPAPLPPAQ